MNSEFKQKFSTVIANLCDYANQFKNMANAEPAIERLWKKAENRMLNVDVAIQKPEIGRMFAKNDYLVEVGWWETTPEMPLTVVGWEWDDGEL